MKKSPPKAAAFPPILKPVCQALDDKKAEDIRVLKVSEQSSITDYLVLATGTSDPHLRALRVELEKVLDQAKVRIVGMDTSQESGWLVIDAFDVMIHVLTPENRQKYALENLWKDAEDVPLGKLVAGAVTARAEKAAPKKRGATGAKRKAASPRAKKSGPDRAAE